MAIIHAENIGKRYDQTVALQKVNLDIEKGELFGLLGPDGAGKTTLIRILTTLILADEGSAEVAGFDVVKNYQNIRSIVGYMPGKFSLYQDLTVEENINFFASLFNTTVAENYDLVRDIYSQIEPFKHRPAGKLSGGMKQKLALSCALIHKPTVLFLDEPSTGVDPVSRKDLWDMLSRLKDEGITIFVSTPYMDEATRCGRVALLKDGQIVHTATPADLVAAYPETLWSVRSENNYHVLLAMREIKGVKTCYAFGDSLHVTLLPTFTPDVLRLELEKAGHTVKIAEIKPSVEDYYMQL